MPGITRPVQVVRKEAGRICQYGRQPHSSTRTDHRRCTAQECSSLSTPLPPVPVQPPGHHSTLLLFVQRLQPPQVGATDLEHHPGVHRHCPVAGIPQTARRPSRRPPGNSHSSSLPEAPYCCESCLEDDGTGDAPFEEYRPPATL